MESSFAFLNSSAPKSSISITPTSRASMFCCWISIWETDGELCKIYQEDIFHFESVGHMMTAGTADASVESRMSWAELESLISHDMFARTHRSYIIGLGHVDVLGKTEVTLDSGTVLPVSRRLEKELREKFVGFHVGCDAVWFP